MKIIISLLVPILLGIVVGSNLSPVITVVIFNQPTVALPIGVWLIIAIGLGLLSSILIQLAIFVDRRLLKRQIRQLQTRLQQSDEDIFTYTSPRSEADSSPREKPKTSNPQKNLFNSYRSTGANKFTSTPPATPTVVDESDDWEVEPRSNLQLDWEDSIPTRERDLQSPTDSYTRQNDRIYPDPRRQTMDGEPEQTRREVYDVDFRLIQPPYKDPLETEFDDERPEEDFEYTKIDEDRDFDIASSSVKSKVSSRSTPSSNLTDPDLDDEDWGFDFEHEDAPVRAK
jgi:hypothetical protein